MLLHAIFPTDPFNALVRDGKVGEILQKILADLKPEAVYFTEDDGMRSALLVVDIATASDIPRMAEPFFLNFDAECRIRPVMTPEDLQAAGLDALGKQWG